jgi:hypothetical protein
VNDQYAHKSDRSLIVTTTTERPDTGTPIAVPAVRNRRPLPDGAVKWSKLYMDDRGAHESPFDVPVDANDRRTAHLRVTCPKAPECTRDAWVEPHGVVIFCRDHGAPMSAERTKRDPVLPWSAMWQTIEKPLRPAWVLAAEAAAGLGMFEGEFTPLAAVLAGGCATGAAYAGTRIYLTKRAVRRSKIEKGQTTGRHVETIRRRSRTAGYIGAIGTAWLTAATTVDPATVLGRVVWASLPIAWAVSAAPWWRYLDADRNRPAPVVATAPVPVDATPSDDAIAAADAAASWTADVGFANTRLDPATWQRTVAGWQAVIVATKKGALVSLTDIERMKSTVAKIAAGYGVKRAAITWISEHDDDPNRALLLVQPNNPLKDGQIWEGPDSVDMEKGRAVSGRLINGDPLYEVLFKPGWGAPNRVTLGTTGGGKSERIRQRLIIERWAHYTDAVTGAKQGAFMSFLHDPKDMDSYGEFVGALHAYGTTRDDAHIMVDAFTREMDRRFAFKRSITWRDKRHGRERFGSLPWDPRVHGPILSAIWDEFHEMAGDKEFVTKIERLARKQRAGGMTQEVASHGGTIGDMGSQVLRDLGGGITTLLQTKNALNAALTAGGAAVGDPRTLPRDPGMCFVVDGETQSAMMARGSWIPYDEETHEVTLYDYLFDEHNQPIGYPAAIPPETAEAFGKEFMEWAEAGKKPGGRDAKAMPGAAFVRTAGAPADATAEAVLRRILFDSPKPLARTEIATDRRWTFGVSTMTNVFRRGQDAKPPWLIRRPEGKGAYELTPAVREEMAGTADEDFEDRAA